MAKPLVIVESPAKARTIGRFLGSDYTVESSVGHIRDLPGKGLGVDVDNGFKPTYEVHAGKRDILKKLRAALKDADELYLATDEDREGEAISWHLLEELNPQIPVKRMVFHEITPEAIDRAVEEWRDIDHGLVDAQETRRIVDRLFGYPVSGVLWRKVNQGLSAGRVQSPAVRLVVERERERIAFVTAGYWDIEAAFATDPGFSATLVGVDGRRVATGKDFDQRGQPKSGDVTVLDEATARDLARRLEGSEFTVRSVEEKPFRSSPKPPFMTSTLQQEGGRKLRLGSAQVMRLAQGLYERGYITYMRTDSTTLSESALAAARRQVQQLYGADHLPDAPRHYARKVKNAQEAHEAIRPAGEQFRTPDSLRGELRGDEHRLYDLIWKRTIASQMVDAQGRTVSVRIGAVSSAPDGAPTPSSSPSGGPPTPTGAMSAAPDGAPTPSSSPSGGPPTPTGAVSSAANGHPGTDAVFAASGRTITFPGYLRAYVEGSDDPEAALDDRETLLPALRESHSLPDPDLDPNGHSTNPPARYTEASLVKRLEELGIGRPSTYASTMQNVQDRGYVWKKGTALVPTWTAFAVVNLLEQHFTDIVDYAYTARMEGDLDDIAARHVEREPWLQGFWFGNGQPGLKSLVDLGLEQIDAAAINTIPVGQDPDGVDIIVKPGRYGPYLKRGEDICSVPADLAPDELTVEVALDLLAAPSGDRVIGTDPDSGLPVIAKAGRFGPYVQLGEMTDGAKEKPRTASLFSTMSLDTIGIEDALKLLSLPRVVGTDPESGEEIQALNGRYGPYLKKGTDSRSLDTEQQLFTVTLDDALRRFAEPKRRGRQAAKPPLKELGDDPVSGQPVVLKEGRFGPYVTDGETNASLRTGDDPDTITPERAAELLKDRRDRGPAKKKRASKKAAKKRASAKRSTTKKKATGKRKAAGKRSPAGNGS